MRLAPLLLVVLAGCSAAQQAATPTKLPRPVTRAQYVQAANEICLANQEEVALAAARPVERRPAHGLRASRAAGIEAVLPVLRRNFARARQLAAPPADARRLRRFWRRADDAPRAFARAARALRSGDRQALASARRRLLAIAGDTRPFARAYGLAECLA